MQRKFGGFLHSICETSLRLFHVPVPRFKQGAPRPLMVTGRPLLTSWAQRATIFHKVQTFTGYSPVFTGIVPKVPGIFQNGTFVLSELTKAPFEPMKDTDLKHLTLKTAFLLALASGKHCSEIHAWVANKVSNLGQWEKVALFPSSEFIAKNQLEREGSQSVSPVTIPALTTIIDRQFKEDRTLCSVRALRYYLDRTKDLRDPSFSSPSRKDIPQTSDPLLFLHG